ncbi:MAG: chorismate mutase [Spirochaetaceae bacterium]|jgi:isochorismate pyruvate lyase|nr:chorismate mutase [Spirochaetaceae bacterium]
MSLDSQDPLISPEACKDMMEIRRAIDDLDQQLVQIIARRAEYVKVAAAFKKDRKAVKDSKRVAQVLESKAALARKYHVSEDLIRMIYKNMIDFFIQQEMEEWEMKKD